MIDNRNILRAVLLALALVPATACDDEVASPATGTDDETLDRIRFYTEGIPEDGMLVFGPSGRSVVPNGPAIRFAEFVTDIPADEGTTAVLTHDIGTARALGLTGGLAWNDGMLYRASASMLTAPTLTALAIAGVAADMSASGSGTCYLADYKDTPSTWDYLRNKGRAPDFIAYGHCVDALARSIEGEEGCVIVTSPVWNPDTEVYDLESYVVCNELL